MSELNGNGKRKRWSAGEKLRIVLARLDAARAPFDLQLPGLRLHQLTGGRSGTWSVRISANWRVTFAFDGNDAIAVDYEDCH